MATTDAYTLLTRHATDPDGRRASIGKIRKDVLRAEPTAQLATPAP